MVKIISYESCTKKTSFKILVFLRWSVPLVQLGTVFVKPFDAKIAAVGELQWEVYSCLS
jgi:hypothetical protein